MARANRTAELLAAARLVDLELGREAEKTRRQSAQSQALASLIPELVQAGTSIAGKVQDYDLAQKKQAADIDYRASLAGLAERKVDLAEKKQTEPKPVTPFAKEKEDRAAAEETRRQARFDEEQRKAKSKTVAEEAGALMTSPVANPSAVRGMMLDEAGEVTDAAIDRSERGISASELEAAGEDAGVSGRALLGRLDASAQKNVDAKRKADMQAADKAQRLAMQREEMARKQAADAQRKAYQDAVLAQREADAKEKAQGRPLPAEMAEKRALKVGALDLVDQVRRAKEAVGTGMLEGGAQKYGSKLISSPKWAEFKALSEMLKRTTGRAIEGGKMAAGDELAYDNFLNNPSDLDDAEFDRVVDVMEWFLSNDLDNLDAGLQGFRLAPRKPRKVRLLEPPAGATTAPSAPKTTAAQDIADGLVTPMGN